MIIVAGSGAMGRFGTVVAKAISSAGNMQLSEVYNPGHAGKVVAG